MKNNLDLIGLFNRWEQVWHEGRFDLVPDCVAPTYLRHDEAGDRVVTREAYAAELAALRWARPDIRILVYDHAFQADRAWYPLHDALDRFGDRGRCDPRGVSVLSYRWRETRRDMGHASADRLGLA
jgi:hypothetical protein